MNDNDPASTPAARSREPWNKGKLIGPKPPLRPSHVWSIRTKLQLEGRSRDLALFNLAIEEEKSHAAKTAYVSRIIAPLMRVNDEAMCDRSGGFIPFHGARKERLVHLAHHARSQAKAMRRPGLCW